MLSMATWDFRKGTPLLRKSCQLHQLVRMYSVKMQIQTLSRFYTVPSVTFVEEYRNFGRSGVPVLRFEGHLSSLSSSFDCYCNPRE
jgi:transposase-like protein